MDSSTGVPQRVLVVGAASEIATSLISGWLRRGTREFALTTRTGTPPKDITEQIAASGGTWTIRHLDAFDRSTIGPALDDAWEPDIDVAVIAIGVLEHQAEVDRDPARAWDMMTVNATATITIALELADRMKVQGHGTIVLLSSVAGARGRRDNFVYGASKAALDTFAEGLTQALEGHGVRVLVARPGYVHSRMSRDIPPAPFAVTTEESALAILRAVAQKRSTVWIPPVLGPIFWVFRLLPARLWSRIVKALR